MRVSGARASGLSPTNLLFLERPATLGKSSDTSGVLEAPGILGPLQCSPPLHFVFQHGVRRGCNTNRFVAGQVRKCGLDRTKDDQRAITVGAEVRASSIRLCRVRLPSFGTSSSPCCPAYNSTSSASQHVSRPTHRAWSCALNIGSDRRLAMLGCGLASLGYMNGVLLFAGRHSYAHKGCITR